VVKVRRASGQGRIGAVSVRALTVVDIDGVVADVRHRLVYLERRPKDWDAFFAAAPRDRPHPEGLDLVRGLAVDHEVVFLTGRPARYRRDTLRWLDRHGMGGHRLVMRPGGDRRPAAQLKVELLAVLAEGRRVALVVDDDVAVVAAVRAAGYPTRLADWERREPGEQRALFEAQERQGRA
jgi:phosphoglycolate phosphatase-like HAD superfamily hydrolase